MIIFLGKQSDDLHYRKGWRITNVLRYRKHVCSETSEGSEWKQASNGFWVLSEENSLEAERLKLLFNGHMIVMNHPLMKGTTGRWMFFLCSGFQCVKPIDIWKFLYKLLLRQVML